MILSMHACIKAIYKGIQSRYYGATVVLDERLVKRCAVCALCTKNQTRAPLQSIVVHRVHERVQIDLTDLRSHPYSITIGPKNPMRWVLDAASLSKACGTCQRLTV